MQVKTINTYDEMMNFIRATCDDCAEIHAYKITNFLENMELQCGTPSLLLSVFQALYENKKYWEITQLVMFFYDLAVSYYPAELMNIQDYEVGLMPYCDIFMQRFEKEIEALEERIPE